MFFRWLVYPGLRPLRGLTPGYKYFAPSGAQHESWQVKIENSRKHGEGGGDGRLGEPSVPQNGDAVETRAYRVIGDWVTRRRRRAT